MLTRIKQLLQSKFKKTEEPPTYEEKRSIIEKYRNRFHLSILVETGTFLGDTVEYFKNKFEKVYSIELSEDLAAKAIKRFESDKNVTIIQGDSGEVLNNLVEEINEPILFWLDGHYSSEFYIGDEYIKTGRGKKDTPVEEELRLIFRSPLNHIVLVDDARLFLGIDDYPSLAEIKKLVKRYNRNYTVNVDNDIIYILPSTQN